MLEIQTSLSVPFLRLHFNATKSKCVGPGVCHNLRPKINPRHGEEETQNTNSNTTTRTRLKANQQSILIAKLESRGGSRISGKGFRMYKGMRGSRLLC